MQVGILSTDGGPHSAEKWGTVSAGQIISIAADAAGEQAIEGRRLELKLLDILELRHNMVMKHEKEALSKYGKERYEHSFDISNHVDETFDEIMAASKGSQFESHFMKEEVQEHIKEVLAKDFRSVIEIERSWHKGELNHRAV